MKLRLTGLTVLLSAVLILASMSSGACPYPPRQTAQTVNVGELVSPALACANVAPYVVIIGNGAGTSTTCYSPPATSGSFSFRVEVDLGPGCPFEDYITFDGSVAPYGNVLPRYQVYSVWYSVPGSGTTSTKNTVQYGSSYTASINTTNSSTWSLATTVALTSGGGLFGLIGTSNSPSSTWTEQQGTNNTAIVSTTEANNLTLTASTTGIGLDHTQDVIWVWLNPCVEEAITASDVVVTGICYDSTDPSNGPDYYPLTVGQLQQLAAGVSPADVTPSVDVDRVNRTWNTTTGPLTVADYSSILEADPFVADPTLEPCAAGSSGCATSRWSIALQPGSTDAQATFNYALGQLATQYQVVATTTNTAGQTASDMHSTSFSVNGEVDFFDLVYASVKITNVYTTTNMASSSTTNMNTQTATIVVAGPPNSSDYTGPTLFSVWKDNVYGTFAFYGVE